MAIKRRSSLPDPELEPAIASEDEDDPSAGRSDFLQGVRLDVYRFIRTNPLCSREDITAGIGMKGSTVTARVKELVDAGYVTEPLGTRKLSKFGVMVRCLQVTDRLQSGVTNDKVQVEVTLTIDCNGRYGVKARVLGGLPQSGKPRAIKTKTMTILAPPNAVSAAARDNSKVTRANRLDLQLAAGQIIDGDFEIVGS